MASGQVNEIRIEGRRFAWRALGSGAPLLLINGYGAGAEDWDPIFLKALVRDFQVICPDNRGIGGSELGPAGLSTDGMAGDLVALLDELAIARAHVAGWSMGGFVAQQLLARAPERIASLSLLATDPGGPEAALAEPETWAQLTDHSGTPREQATRLIGLLFPSEVAAEIDRQYGALVAAARAQLLPDSLKAQEGAMGAWHRNGIPAQRSECPVLICHGALDVVIPAANADALGERLGSNRIELFEGAGHAFMAQNPQRAASLICAAAAAGN